MKFQVLQGPPEGETEPIELWLEENYDGSVSLRAGTEGLANTLITVMPDGCFRRHPWVDTAFGFTLEPEGHYVTMRP